MERNSTEGGNSVKDSHDGDEVEKKSITEGAIKVMPDVPIKPTVFPRNT